MSADRGATATRAADRGSALVAAIAVAAVVMLLATTVVTVAVRSEAGAARDRGRTQALAAAEAGLDAALLALRSLDSATQASFPCTTTSEVWSSPGTSQVVVSYAFSTTTTAAVACPLASGVRMSQVQVTSTATLTTGATTVRRAMQATVALGSAGADPSGTFDRALFSDGQVATSGTLTTAGGVYTNGYYACAGQTAIAGPLTVQGDLSASGSCRADGDVHVGGRLACTGAIVGGDLTVAGVVQNQMSDCTVEGSAVLAGAFSFSGSTRIGGTLTSASSAGSAVGSGTRVAGAARVRSTVTGATEATFPGGLTPNANPAPAAPPAPPRQEMPVVRYVPADWAGSTTMTAQQFFATSGAPTSPGNCSFVGSSTRVLRATAPSTVVDATGCSSFSLSGATVSLSGDLTLFVPNLSASGSLAVRSADAQPHVLRVIVPARSTTDVCAAGGGGVSSSAAWTVDDAIRTFVYAPGTVALSGLASLRGAVYTCGFASSSDLTIAYDTSALPPVGGLASTAYTSSPPTKADVS